MFDPLAVRDHNLANLPTPVARLRADFETDKFEDLPGFGQIWTMAIGGQRETERFIRNCFEPPQKRFGEHFIYPQAANIGERPIHFEIGKTVDIESDEDWSVPRPEAVDILSARLGLVTALQEAEGRVSKDLLNALAGALEVRDRLEKRIHAEDRAMRFAEARAAGLSPTQAIVKTLAGLPTGPRRISPRKLWQEIGLPTMARVIAARIENLRKFPDSASRADAMRAGVGRSYPRATDEWFDGEFEESVAELLIRECSASRQPTLATRWDVFCLVEGFQCRRRPVSVAVQILLDLALGLLDAKGRPRPKLFLGGVERRRDFVRFVRDEVSPPDGRHGRNEVEIAPNTETDWRRSFLWKTALEVVDARLKRQSLQN